MFNRSPENLAWEIKSAFADVQYPGDNDLVYDDGGLHLDVAQTANAFKGQHWKTLPLNILHIHRDHLPFLTPSAFHFFLPAFLLASALHPTEVDTLTENIIYMLTPEPSHLDANWPMALAIRMNSKQREAIRAFLQYWKMKEPILEDDIRLADEYWRKQSDFSRRPDHPK